MPPRRATSVLITFVSLLALVTAGALARQAPVPVILLTDEQGSPVSGVTLASADVHGAVRGPAAEITVTLQFSNNDGVVRGGDLIFPLPEGATVTGYALDVHGSMVDGVPVDKQQARDIYNTESRKRIDPGLVENVNRNVFRTRLYPIPANGLRSARVRYVAKVATTATSAMLSVPMGWGNAKTTVKLELPEASADPVIDPPNAVMLRKTPHGFVAQGTLGITVPVLTVRLAQTPGQSVAIEQRLLPIDDDNKNSENGASKKSALRPDETFEYFFLLNDTPPPPPVDPAPQTLAELWNKPVRRVAILWDAGLRRANSDKHREMEMLESILRAWRGATGDLVVFRDKVEAPIVFDLGTQRRRDEIIEQLNLLTYDGASDLSRLPLPKNASGFRPNPSKAPIENMADFDCLLLFTDGLGELGTPTLQRSEVPVYAFSDSPAANARLLDDVCRKSGGRFFNLANYSADWTSEPWSLISVESQPDEITDLYPNGPVPAAGLSRLTLTGRLLAPKATVVLNYGYGTRVIHRQSVTLDFADAAAGTLVSDYWALHKVAELSAPPEMNGSALSSIGKRFGLVTPNTSLLVLETPSQYVRYGVVPPRNQSQLYEDYLVLTGQMPERWASDRIPMQNPDETSLDRIVSLWHSQIDWWNESRPRLWERGTNSPPADDHRLNHEARTERRADEKALRTHLANEANARTIDAAATFYSALSRTARDIAQENFAAAEDELSNARTTLSGDLGATPQERDEFTTRLSDVQQQLDEAETGATKTTPGSVAAKAHREVEQIRRGVNTGHGHDFRNGSDKVDYCSGGLFGGSGGGSGGSGGGGLFGSGSGGAPPVADRGPRGGSGKAPSAGSEQVPPTGEEQTPSAGAGQPPSTGLTAPPDALPVNSFAIALPTTAPAVHHWDPARPYLLAMKQVPAEQAYNVFLKQRRTFGDTPEFYLDCADYLGSIGQHVLALRVLSNVVTFHAADGDLLRAAAWRFQELGKQDYAIELLERAVQMGTDQFQASHDLALALSDRARSMPEAPCAADYGRSLDLLNTIILHDQSGGSELCLMDANCIFARLQTLWQDGAFPRITIPLDTQLVRNLDCDMRIVVTTDTDQFNPSLTVAEPAADSERTRQGWTSEIGARIDGADNQSGQFGAQEYCLRKLVPGQYRVRLHLVPTGTASATGPVTVRVMVFSDFGRPSETKQTMDVRVIDPARTIEICVSMYPNSAPRIQRTPGFLSIEVPQSIPKKRSRRIAQ